MTALFRLVRALQEDRLTPEQRAALERLVIALDVGVEMDPDPRAPWTATAHAYRELVAVPDRAAVVRLRPVPGGPS